MEPGAERRRTAGVTVRRFESATEADRHDLEYWLSLSPDERLAQVWRMSVELWPTRRVRPQQARDRARQGSR